MASSSSSAYMKGKGMVEEIQPQEKFTLSLMEGGGVVLSPNPISSVRPGSSSKVGYAPRSKRVLNRSKKFSDSYVSFTLSNAEADYVKRLDEVCAGLSKAAGAKSWIPVADRLSGWVIETHQRLCSSKKIEQFFHHPRLSRALRSKKHVVHFICYGSVLPPEEGKVKKSPKAENEACGKRRRINGREIYKTDKEFVEAFLAESYNNLMNLAH